MASNSSDPFGNTNTFDAGVDNSASTNDNCNAQTPGRHDVSTLTSSYGAPRLDNVQINWYTGDAVGADDDLFGQFICSPKTPHSPPTSMQSVNIPSSARAKSFSRYFNPRELLAHQAEANFDPQLRSQATNSPRRSERLSAAGSSGKQHEDANSWNVPPVGHSFWKTFPFQEYMASVVALCVDTEKAAFGLVEMAPQAQMYPNPSDIGDWANHNPTELDSQPFANPDPFSINQTLFGFQQAHQVQPQNVPSQYEEPNYYAAIPGYGPVPNSITQFLGNTQQNFGFDQNQQQNNTFQSSVPQVAFPNFDQVSLGGLTAVEAWLPSATPAANSGNTSGLGSFVPVNDPFKPDVGPTEEVTPFANPDIWDAERSESKHPIPRKLKKPQLNANGKKVNARTQASLLAQEKAKDAYKPRLRPSKLVVEDEKTETRYEFGYNSAGELEGTYSPEELTAYILNKYNRSNKENAWMLIQCVPADSFHRYPSRTSDKCRFKDCTSKQSTIAQGTFRVAFDEDVNAQKFDPFHTAGFVHLYCLERFIDFEAITQRCKIAPDTRKLKVYVEGTDHPSRLNLNRTSMNNQKTANDHLSALADGTKLPTGFDGQPWEYSKTLCWKLTRNALADAKTLRVGNARKRGGVNIFVHINDEQKKVDLLERKKYVDDEVFAREVDMIFQQTIAEVGKEIPGGGLPAPKTGSELAQRRDKTYICKKRKNPEQLATPKSAASDEHGVRRSSRLSKSSTPVLSQGERRSTRFSNPSPFAMPALTKVTQGRKRSRELSETDTQGSEDDSPKTVRPAKKPKLNGPPNPLLPLQQERLNSRTSALMSSPLSPPPKTPKTPTTARRWPSFEADLAAAVNAQHDGQSSPLSPPPPTPLLRTPIVQSNQGRKRSRHDSDGSLFGNSDAESTTSKSGRPIKEDEVHQIGKFVVSIFGRTTKAHNEDDVQQIKQA